MNRRIAAVLFASPLPSPALAEDPKPAAAPSVGAEPQTTTASYGDWTLSLPASGRSRRHEQAVRDLATIQAGQQRRRSPRSPWGDWPGPTPIT